MTTFYVSDMEAKEWIVTRVEISLHGKKGGLLCFRQGKMKEGGNTVCKSLGLKTEKIQKVKRYKGYEGTACRRLLPNNVTTISTNLQINKYDILHKFSKYLGTIN